MSAPTTYSFLDVLAALTGPGGSINLGAGAGVAEEGITVDPNADIDAMTIGSDGVGMHSLIANPAGKVTCRFLKTSPTNQQLQAMMNLQRVSGSLHGQNTITVTNKVTGDVITAEQAGFAKQPTIVYSKEGQMIEWEFNALKITTLLGAGVSG